MAADLRLPPASCHPVRLTWCPCATNPHRVRGLVRLAINAAPFTARRNRRTTASMQRLIMMTHRSMHLASAWAEQTHSGRRGKDGQRTRQRCRNDAAPERANARLYPCGLWILWATAGVYLNLHCSRCAAGRTPLWQQRWSRSINCGTTYVRVEEWERTCPRSCCVSVGQCPCACVGIGTFKHH
jgi:hypothetical protein